MNDFLALLATDPFIFRRFGSSPIWVTEGRWHIEWLGDKLLTIEIRDDKPYVLFEYTFYDRFKQAKFWYKDKPYGAVAIYDLGLILLKELNDVDAHSIPKPI